MRILSRISAALLIVFALATLSAAAERIVSFDSSIRVERDGRLGVREDITVRIEHNRINRGIFRDFPTRYKDTQGRSVEVGFSVGTVLLDGGPVPWKTEGISNGVRIRIGDPNSYAPLGDHTYTIVYTTTEQIGFFEDHDELYWNVTGTGWEFPIDRATALITLPEDGTVEKIAWYTGPQGSRSQDASGRIAGNTAWFETTSPLGANEGLTIVAGFPKGIVTPSESYLRSQARAAMAERYGKVIPPLVVLLLLVYYLAVWTRYGKDLRPGQIIPLFYPPEGVTPAMASYVYHQKNRDDTFTATLIDLAVRGFLRIEEHDVPKGLFRRNKDRFTLHPTDKKTNDLQLVEKVFLGALFPGGASLPVDKESHEELLSAKSAIRDHISTRGSDYFLRNWGWVALGVLVTVLLIGGSGLFLGSQSGDFGFLLVSMALFTGWTIGVSAFVYIAFSSLREGIRRRKFTSIIRGLFFSMFSIPFIGGEIVVLAMLTDAASLPFALSFMAALVINVLFFYLMKNYTPEGRKLLDELQGFRMYMMAAEKERIRAMAGVDMPEDTPEQFERLLPYAIALGVEKQWAARFESVLKAAEYNPGWYVGTYPWYLMGASSFMTDLSGGLGSAIASSAVAPGSSSGFGGGGFSGGGGGGGGGGGW